MVCAYFYVTFNNYYSTFFLPTLTLFKMTKRLKHYLENHFSSAIIYRVIFQFKIVIQRRRPLPRTLQNKIQKPKTLPNLFADHIRY